MELRNARTTIDCFIQRFMAGVKILNVLNTARSRRRPRRSWVWHSVMCGLRENRMVWAIGWRSRDNRVVGTLGQYTIRWDCVYTALVVT